MPGINAPGHAVVERTTLANRPASGSTKFAGRLWSDSSTNQLFIDTGAVWATVANIYTFATVAAVKASTRADITLAYVTETATLYYYVASSQALSADDLTVIAGGAGSADYWVAMLGQYAFSTEKVIEGQATAPEDNPATGFYKLWVDSDTGTINLLNSTGTNKVAAWAS